MGERDAVEQVSRLETLHRLCRRRGWALCLAATADARTPDGRRPVAHKPGAVLDSLVVVDPLRDERPRHAAVYAGDPIARIPLHGGAQLELAAELILDSLGQRGLLETA